MAQNDKDVAHNALDALEAFAERLNDAGIEYEFACDAVGRGLLLFCRGKGLPVNVVWARYATDDVPPMLMLTGGYIAREPGEEPWIVWCGEQYPVLDALKDPVAAAEWFESGHIGCDDRCPSYMRGGLSELRS